MDLGLRSESNGLSSGQARTNWRVPPGGRVGVARSGAGPSRADRAVLEALEPRQMLAVVTWDGGGDGRSWNDPLNWSADVLPGPADDARVLLAAAGGTQTRLVLPGTNAGANAARVKSLKISGAVELSGGRLLAADFIRLSIDDGRDSTIRISPETSLEAPSIVIDAGAGGFARVEGSLRAVAPATPEAMRPLAALGLPSDANPRTGLAWTVGGQIRLLGQRIALLGAKLDAGGELGGGQVLVGGNLLGEGPEPNSRFVLLNPQSQVLADATVAGPGGRVIAYADRGTSVTGTLSAMGGELTGSGGLIETSGREYLYAEPAAVWAQARAAGNTPGLWLVDPTNITIQASANDNIFFDPVTGNVALGASSAAFLSVTQLATALGNGVNVTVFTRNPAQLGAGNITLNAALTPAMGANTATLTLRAANNVQISAGVVPTATTGRLNLSLLANDGTGATGNETPDDPNPAAGDVVIGSPITLINGGVFTARGVNFSMTATAVTASISAAGGTAAPGTVLTVDVQMTGAISIGRPIASGNNSMLLWAGTDGSGDLLLNTFSTQINAFAVSLFAGDDAGPGTTARASFGTQLNWLRGASGLTGPDRIDVRQDAGMLDADILAPNAFGNNSVPPNFLYRSFAGSILVTTAAKIQNAAGGNGTLTADLGSVTVSAANISTGNLTVNGFFTLAPGTHTFGNLLVNGVFELAGSMTINASSARFTQRVDRAVDAVVAALTTSVSGLARFDGPIGSQRALSGLTVLAPVNAALQLAANVTVSGPMSVTPAVTLAGAVIVSAGAANIGFAAQINGGFALELNTTGASSIAGFGAVTPLASFRTSNGGSTTMSGSGRASGLIRFDDATTLNGASLQSFASAGTTGMTFGSSLQLTGSVNLDGGGSNIDLLFGANSGITPGSLVISTTGVFIVRSNIGSASALASLAVASGGTVNMLAGANIFTTGNQLYSSRVLLSSPAGAVHTFQSSAGLLGFLAPTGIDDSAVAGQNGVVLSGTSVEIDGNIGTGGALLSMALNAPLVLSGLAGERTWVANSFTFNAIDAQDTGEQGVVLNGNVTFNGPVGQGAALSQLVVNGSTTVNSSLIRTTSSAGRAGTQSYNAVVLGAGGASVASFEGSAVTFTGTLNASTLGARGVAVVGNATFSAAVGAGLPLRSLSVSGATNLAAGVTTSNAAGGSGDQTFSGAVTLSGNAALAVSPTSAGTITFGSTLNADLAGSRLLSLAAATVNLQGSIGQVTRPLQITISTTTNLSLTLGIATSGQQSFSAPSFTLAGSYVSSASGLSFNGAGAITLVGATTLNSGNGGLNINPTVNGAFALTLQGAGAATIAGRVGGVTPLASLSVANPLTLNSDVAVTGSLLLQGSVTLGGGAGSLRTLQAASTTFNSTVNASAVGSQGLSVIGNAVFTALGQISTSALASISVSGSTSLGGSAGTAILRTSTATGGSGALSLGGPMTLLGDAIIRSDGGPLILNAVNVNGRSLQLTGAEIDLLGNVTTTPGGSLALAPASNTQQIVLGPAGSSPALDLSAAELARIGTGFSSVTIGSGSQAGSITVASAVTFQSTLSLLAPVAPAQIQINAPLLLTGGSALFISGSGQTLVLNASIITNGQLININDSVVVGAPGVRLDTTGGGTSPGGAEIFISGPINSAPGQALGFELRAGTTGPVSILSSVGAAPGGTLGTFTVSAGGLFIGSFGGNPVSFNSIGLISINAAVQINTSLLLNASSAVLFSSTITGSSAATSLSVNSASSVAFGGSITGLGLFSVNAPPLVGAVAFAGAALSASTITVGAPATFSAPIVTVTGANISFGVLTAPSSTFTFALAASDSLVSFGGATVLAGLIINGPVGAQTLFNADVTATGGASINTAATVLGGAGVLRTIRSSTATLLFARTLDIGATTTALRGQQVDLGGAVTGTGRLLLLPAQVDQNINVAAGPETDALNISQTELNQLSPSLANVQIGLDDGSGDIAVGFTGGPNVQLRTDTTFSAPAQGGSFQAAAPINQGTDNAGVTVRGSNATSDLFASITTRGGPITFFDSVRLRVPNVQLITNAQQQPGGLVRITGAVNSVGEGINGLTITSGQGAVNLSGAIGAAVEGALAFLIINTSPGPSGGGINLASSIIRTSGQQTYNGPTTLGANVTIQTIGSPVNFNGTLGGAQNLTIGAGTGATNFNGAVGTLNTLTINSGSSRSFASSVSVGVLTIFGGTVEFNAPAAIGSAVFISGSLTGSGDVAVTQPFTWIGGSMTGTGRLLIAPTGSLVISGSAAKTLARPIQTSGVTFWTDGNVTFLDGASFVNLPGGVFNAQADGSFFAPVGANATFNNQGVIERSGPGASGFDRLGFSQSGTLRVLDGMLRVTPAGGSLLNTGVIDLRAGANSPVGPGTLSVIGALNLGAGGSVVVELASPTLFGRISSIGNANVDGALAVVFAPGYAPFPGVRHAIVTAPNVSGQFATINGVRVPVGRTLVQENNSNRIDVRLGATLDFNGDGLVNIDDLSDFITAFFEVPPDGNADFNGDGFANVDDLTDFITAFFGG